MLHCDWQCHNLSVRLADFDWWHSSSLRLQVWLRSQKLVLDLKLWTGGSRENSFIGVGLKASLFYMCFWFGGVCGENPHKYEESVQILHRDPIWTRDQTQASMQTTDQSCCPVYPGWIKRLYISTVHLLFINHGWFANLPWSDLCFMWTFAQEDHLWMLFPDFFFAWYRFNQHFRMVRWTVSSRSVPEPMSITESDLFFCRWCSILIQN